MSNEIEIVYGRNVVQEILKSGRRKISCIYLSSAGKTAETLKDIIKIVKNKKIQINIVSPQNLDQITQGGVHQGIAAKVSGIPLYSIEEILRYTKQTGEIPFFVVLNNIHDPHNIGAILRSAEACGVHGLIIPYRHSAAINATVVKTSSGASEYVPVIKEYNIAQCLDKLKENGIWIFGADAKGTQKYYNADFSLPLALVLGNEGEGLQRLVKEKCDFLVNIPMSGKINSLNVSIAGAIFMFEVLRKRI